MHLRQKVRPTPELSPKFLSNSGPNPTRKARPELQLCFAPFKNFNVLFLEQLFCDFFLQCGAILHELYHCRSLLFCDITTNNTILGAFSTKCKMVLEEVCQVGQGTASQVIDSCLKKVFLLPEKWLRVDFLPPTICDILHCVAHFFFDLIYLDFPYFRFLI